MNPNPTQILHVISTNEDGYTNWLKVHEQDPRSKMICIEFLSSDKNDLMQSKHKMILTEQQLDNLGSFIKMIGNL